MEYYMRAWVINIRTWILSLIFAFIEPINAQESLLPSLGDSSSTLVSLEQEHRLGRTLIRQMRFYFKTMEHPIAREYVKNLIYRLAKHSQVADRRFEFLLIDTAQLNAFAAPGGIIGVNAGLFLHATTEHEFAAVMAHELAHLSQRHFARQLEERKKQAPLNLASLLGSILLIASNNAEAGIASLITTQAAVIQTRLSYSRDWEREADRLGIITLEAAEFDPRGMPDMFQRMLDTYRFSELPPEFLLTHPVSDKRVADAAARLDAQELSPKPANIDYLYLRNEFIGQYQHPSKEGITHFERAIKQSKTQAERLANQYGLAMAKARVGEYFEAKQALEALLKRDPSRILLQAAYGNLLIESSRPNEAIKYLKKPMSLAPNNYSLALIYAKALIHTQNHTASIPLLKNMALEYPNDPYVWELKSQAHKLAKEPLLELQSTAEALFLRGETQRAIEHLKYARQRAKGQFQQLALINERIREMNEDERLASF
jgi:predicted Zn-dependent protease